MKVTKILGKKNGMTYTATWDDGGVSVADEINTVTLSPYMWGVLLMFIQRQNGESQAQLGAWLKDNYSPAALREAQSEEEQDD
jgi:hypothetical protein